MLAGELDGERPQVVVAAEVLEVDRLGVGRDDRHASSSAIEPFVVLPAELVVAAVVEVADAARLGVDHLDRDRRLLVRGPVGEARGVGEPPGVDVDGEHAAERDLVLHVGRRAARQRFTS